MVNDKPVCIVTGDRKISECIQYLSGYNADINDGKIKKIFDKFRKDDTKVDGCCCCAGGACLYYKDDDNLGVILRDGKISTIASGKSIMFKVKYCPNCGKNLIESRILSGK